MILCRNPRNGLRGPRPRGLPEVGIVIDGTARFTEKHARHYISLYRTKSGSEAKKWALEVLAKEPRERMIARVNEIQNENKGKGRK